MKVATASFRFRLLGPGVEGAAEQLMSVFSPALVRPKSMELQLVGLSGGLPAAAVRHKFPGSVDGDVPWAGSWGLPLLSGERRAAGGFTRLSREGSWLTLPRDHEPVLGQVKTFREMALRQESTGEARRAWVVWTFWGPTRVFYPSPSGGLREGWFLRECLEHHNALVPVLRLVCQFGGHPCAPFEWRAQTHSHLWSYYSSRYDRDGGGWVRKGDVTAPELNALLLARALGSLLLRFPNASFSWDVEREHGPDLTGCVPDVIGRLFGPPHAQLEVAAIAGLDRCRNGHAE
jgi:hypothetical protein